VQCAAHTPLYTPHKQILTVVKNAAAGGTAAADALAAARAKARKEEADAAAHLRKVLILNCTYTHIIGFSTADCCDSQQEWLCSKLQVHLQLLRAAALPCFRAVTLHNFAVTARSALCSCSVIAALTH
jgi:hypothetical protein